jgi:hypothetical protein
VKIIPLSIVFNREKEYPSWAGKIYPSTIEEECSTTGNAGREGIPGIFGQKNQFHIFHKCKEFRNTIGNCLTI